MARLRHEEWLDAAKRLPVGRSDRIFHKSDASRRANLVVSNHADQWTAYCFACKVGAVVPKTHIRLTDRAPKESTELTVPDDIVMAYHLDQFTRKSIESFFLTKGVIGGMLDQWGYSASRKRLIVYPQNWRGRGSLGRDVTGNSDVKWIRYGDPALKWVVEPLYPEVGKRGLLILTEDIFSMYKVRWALMRKLAGEPWGDSWVGTTLGTGILPGMLHDLAKNPFDHVVVFYDGDRAGEDGSRTVARRVRAITGSKVTHVTAPHGYDPKDLDYRGLVKVLTDAGVHP